MKGLAKATGKRNGSKNNQTLITSPNRFAQIVCAILISSIFTVSVPAAPLAIKVSAGETYQDIRFGLLSSNFGANLSGWANTLLFFLPAKQQTQSINRIEIKPGDDSTIRQGEPVNFSAIAYSTEGNPVNGLKFKWTVQDVDRNLLRRTFAGTTR